MHLCACVRMRQAAASHPLTRWAIPNYELCGCHYMGPRKMSVQSIQIISNMACVCVCGGVCSYNIWSLILWWCQNSKIRAHLSPCANSAVHPFTWWVWLQCFLWKMCVCALSPSIPSTARLDPAMSLSRTAAVSWSSSPLTLVQHHQRPCWQPNNCPHCYYLVFAINNAKVQQHLTS